MSDFIVEFIDDPAPFTVEFKDVGLGLSAYEVAMLNGFIGTEQEWLDTLKSDITKSIDPPDAPYLNQLWIQL